MKRELITALLVLFGFGVGPFFADTVSTSSNCIEASTTPCTPRLTVRNVQACPSPGTGADYTLVWTASGNADECDWTALFEVVSDCTCGCTLVEIGLANQALDQFNLPPASYPFPSNYYNAQLPCQTIAPTPLFEIYFKFCGPTGNGKHDFWDGTCTKP